MMFYSIHGQTHVSVINVYVLSLNGNKIHCYILLSWILQITKYYKDYYYYLKKS